jgi:hypothetical protein
MIVKSFSSNRKSQIKNRKFLDSHNIVAAIYIDRFARDG